MRESIRGRYLAIFGCQLVIRCSAGASRNFESTLGHDRIPASSRIGHWSFCLSRMRRLGVVRCIACIPAAIPLLSGDHLYLEHTVMADFLDNLPGCGGHLGGSLRISSQFSLWVACGRRVLCSATAGLTRNVGVVLVPILGLCSACLGEVFTSASVGWRLRPLLPAIFVFGCYWSAYKLAHGQYLGLNDMSGWNLYARVAPFADCRKFTAPAGTAIFCEARPRLNGPGLLATFGISESTPRQNVSSLGPRREEIGRICKACDLPSAARICAGRVDRPGEVY